ncbi:MAG: holo-ACP synthase [Candidatus Cloacimonetes bacterium]|nr:holo-ACP synthase [Candidatus Cloacimonadota bacterium]
MIFGHGIDIIEVSRIREAIKKTVGFREKVFTENEIAYCETKKEKYQSYAARFAVKEAFMKALGTGFSKGASWKDIEVLNNPDGKPYILLYGVTRDIFYNIKNEKHSLRKSDKDAENIISEIYVSISHTKELAIASVILE